MDWRNVLYAVVLSFAWRAFAQLQRDVCVIGGGSSGTYAAIRLQQMGMDVALIEEKDRLGGMLCTGLATQRHEAD